MNRRRTFLPVLCTLVALITAGCARPTATPVPPTPVPVNTEAPTATPVPSVTPTPGPTVTPTPDPNMNPLTGEMVADPATLQHRPILVRYGHDRESRPQSGLTSADMVYEELAEGNFITRITGVFLSEIPDVAGPIRSTRLAVFEMLHQLDAALVDAGASDPIMWMLSTLPQYPQFRHTSYGAEYFFRSADKSSPYNLYVHLPQVRSRIISDGTDTPVHVHNMVFSGQVPEGSEATHIHVPYPGVAPVDLRYDAGSGSYLRFVEGVPHTDALNGEQLAPQNVVVIYCEHKPQPQIVEDKLGNVAIMVWWVGTGRAQVFRDGVMVEGQWLRPEAADQMRLIDGNGQDIPLKPGQTWIEIVPLDYKVTVE